ncbi:acyltransferase [Ostreiculturibacter nitratireducens]|uniref:acyltransferase family protein n=1 Tax=Ostreiculturibacter nitratireducens TaxID=3075226 RepID=UPI0031B62FDB
MIPNIQVLRAFAAIIVVIFHAVDEQARVGGSSGQLSFFHPWGASGVDIFFVISGFIMAFVQDNAPRSPFRFFEARIVRIFPMYFIVTVVWACATYFALRWELADTDISISYIILSLAFLSQALGYEHPFIVPGWTLEFEMLFYAIFALSLFFRRPKSLLLVAICALAFLSGLSLIILEFAFGVLVALAFKNDTFRNLAPYLLPIGILGYVSSAIFELPDLGRSDLESVLYWGLPGTLIVLSSLYVRQLQAGWLILLGNASYSIYLTHTCTISVVRGVFDFSDLGPINADLYVVLTSLICIAVGLATYWLIEQPVTNYLKVKLKTRRQRTVLVHSPGG